MKRALQCLLRLTCIASLICSIVSCSSGGSGSGEGVPPPVSATTPQTIVSGTVQSPGGQIAFFKKPGFDDWLESEAYAAKFGPIYRLVDYSSCHLKCLPVSQSCSWPMILLRFSTWVHLK